MQHGCPDNDALCISPRERIAAAQRLHALASPYNPGNL